MSIEWIKVVATRQVVALWFVLFVAVCTQAAVINVPGDQPTIQAGVNAAVDGDTVLVAAGVYTENVRFNGKEAILKSADGAAATIIEPLDPNISVISFLDSEGRGAVIEGFRLQHDELASGVKCEGTSPVIRSCEFINTNSQLYAPGIFSTNGEPSVISCVLTSCSIVISAPSIDTVLIQGNIVHDHRGDAISVGMSTAPVIITGNEIFDNDGGILIAGSENGGVVSRNVVYNNTVRPGIMLYGMVDFEVSFNTSYGNETGIVIDYDQASAYGGNNIVVNNIGVGLYDADHALTNNLVWGNGTPFANPPHPPNTFIDADPKFVAPSSGDFSLTCESPAIDAGDPAMTDPDGSIADMGAISFNHITREVCDTIFIPGVPPLIVCYIDSTLPAAMNLRVDNEPTLQLSSASPMFSWEAVTGGTQLAFECEVIRLDSTGTTVIFGSGEVVSATASFTYSGPSLEAGLSYVFRLRLRDSSGWSCWRSIVIRRNAAPNKAWPQLPEDGARVREGEVDLQVRPETDPEGDLVAYRFEVYSDESLSQLAGSSVAVATAPGNVHSGLIGGLVAGSTYWWRCRTFDDSDSASWSSTYSFLVASPGVIHVPTDFTDIPSAVEYAINGDTIDIVAGVYELTSVVNTQGKGICFQGQPQAEGTTIRKLTGGYAFDVSAPAHSWVEFLHLMIEGGPAINARGNLKMSHCAITRSRPGSTPLIVVAGDALIENCTIVESDGYAIGGLLDGSESIQVQRCLFQDASAMPGYTAILLMNEGTMTCNLTMVGNVIHHPGAEVGIGLWGAFDGSIIGNVVDKTTSGIKTGVSSPTLRIANNIISNCSQSAIVEAASADFNNLWNNGTDYVNSPPGANDIHVDPQFVDAANGDYRLQCTSPCIDAGDPATGTACFGKAIDIGAFEFEYTIGNANGNTSGSPINLADAVFLVNYIFGGGTAPCPSGAGDVDCDDLVTISDVVYLVTYLYAHGPVPCGGC